MKKVKVVGIVGFLLVLLYVVLFTSNIIWGYLGDKDTLVLSIVLICISISSIYKGAILKSSSTMWFAICLILFSIIIVIFNLFDISHKFYYLFVFIPIISSVINIIIFKYVIYFKVIILNLSIAIPVVLSSLFDFQLWLNITLYVSIILLGIIICRLIYFRKEKI